VPSKPDPAAALADILQNIERIDDYLAGVDRETFGRDALRRDAVERCLERLCEAAFRLGDNAAELAPDQPWADIRGMGNRLRHAYDRINVDIVWTTVQHRLPGLKRDVSRALAHLREEEFTRRPSDQRQGKE
jgi:uncharacterized protein with HEPN domain